MPTKQEPKFTDAMQELTDLSHPYEGNLLRLFSDPNPEGLKTFKLAWPNIPPERRLQVMERMEEFKEIDTRLSFTEVARFVLEDLHPKARTSALRILYEEEDLKLISIFIRLMNKDPEPEVRATAASSLGFYVYLGMLEEIPEDQAIRVVDALVVKMNGDDEPIVRRRALESMGYATRADVDALIRNAYLSQDKEWISSALFAMARSGLESWEKYVLTELDNEEPDVQLEAIRAAGELGLDEARERLLDFLDNPELLDEEIRLTVLVSLAGIGGDGVREALLHALEESESEEETELIEGALEDLDFTEEIERPLLFNFDDLDTEDDDEVASGPYTEED